MEANEGKHDQFVMACTLPGNTQHHPSACVQIRDVESEEGDGLQLKTEIKCEESEEEPYTCETCYESFTDFDMYVHHLETHRRNTLACATCKAEFTELCDLSQHVLSGCKLCKTEDVKDDSRYQSPEDRPAHVVSGKPGNQKGPLKKHRQTLSGKKSYECDQCDKVFTSKASLTDHLRSHSGEKPFECDQCNKVFSRKSCLTVHLRTHSEEKPYQCEQCDKAFKRNLF